MGPFNLGNFGGKLSMGDLNGALGKAGADFKFDEEEQEDLPQQAVDDEVPGEPRSPMGGISDAPLKGAINLQNIGTLIGGYFGGPAGAKIGGAVGGMASKNVEKQKAKGVLG